MATSLEKISTLTPVTIVEYRGTYTVTLDATDQTFSLLFADGSTPANDFSDIFNPGAGQTIELTISVTGTEVATP